VLSSDRLRNVDSELLCRLNNGEIGRKSDGLFRYGDEGVSDEDSNRVFGLKSKTSPVTDKRRLSWGGSEESIEL